MKRNVEGTIPFSGNCVLFSDKRYLTYEITYTIITNGELEGYRNYYIYSIVDDVLFDCQNIFSNVEKIEVLKT